MRLFIGGIATESNGFVSYPTPQRDFRCHREWADDDQVGWVLSAARPWRRLVTAAGWTVVPGLLAWAMPSGPTTRRAYESMRNELLDDLRRALPVNGVLLDLHGAMVADGYPDAEGDLIERCREVVGPAVPIGVCLDCHCHLTERMARHATVMVAMKHWPHVDVPERAREVLDLVVAARDGRATPVMAVADCRMVGAYPTEPAPMAAFVARMKAAERQPGILSVTLAHGYPWADVAEAGTRVLVVADGDATLAHDLAETLAREFFALRDQVTEHGDLTVDQALDYLDSAPSGPVVLCEQGDNHLGGSAGDGTHVLEKVIARGLGNIAFGPIWDPMSVDICRTAGVGERIRLRIGGKSGPEAGNPVDLSVVVRQAVDELVQDAMGPIGPLSLGPAVLVSTDDGVEVVLHAARNGTLRPNALTGVGVDLAAKRAIICKMWRHGAEGFRTVSNDIRILRTPGAQTLEFAAIPYRVRTRQYWPRVADPFRPGS
ncbi:MAG: M81 family metallopeptidase [Gemmatimonadales bacterium]|nr:M81 family metallopeptidase [Gemmatimonadales bacterium]